MIENEFANVLDGMKRVQSMHDNLLNQNDEQSETIARLQGLVRHAMRFCDAVTQGIGEAAKQLHDIQNALDGINESIKRFMGDKNAFSPKIDETLGHVATVIARIGELHAMQPDQGELAACLDDDEFLEEVTSEYPDLVAATFQGVPDEGGAEAGPPWLRVISDKKATRRFNSYYEQVTKKRINWSGPKRQGVMNRDVRLVMETVQAVVGAQHPQLSLMISLFIDGMGNDMQEFEIARRAERRQCADDDTVGIPATQVLINIMKYSIWLTEGEGEAGDDEE